MVAVIVDEVEFLRGSDFNGELLNCPKRVEREARMHMKYGMLQRQVLLTVR